VAANVLKRNLLRCTVTWT